MPAVVQGVKGLQRPLKGFGLRDLGKDEKTLALADSAWCETLSLPAFARLAKPQAEERREWEARRAVCPNLWSLLEAAAEG